MIVAWFRLLGRSTECLGGPADGGRGVRDPPQAERCAVSIIITLERLVLFSSCSITKESIKCLKSKSFHYTPIKIKVIPQKCIHSDTMVLPPTHAVPQSEHMAQALVGLYAVKNIVSRP